MNETFEIRIDGQLQEPSTIERITTATLSHVQTAVGGLATKFGDWAERTYKELDIADFDRHNGTNLYAQYKAQLRHDKVAAIVEQYDIRPVRDAVGRYSLL
jgi:hypothetical protein